MKLRQSGLVLAATLAAFAARQASAQAPDALNLLFSGGNTGKVIVEL